MIVIRLLVRAFLMVMLVAFAVGSCTTADSDSADPGKTVNETADMALKGRTDTLQQSAKVIAYYFHTTYRCPSCKRIEAFSTEAIDSGFQKELADSTLVFHSINIDEPENKHYTKDYKLYTKSLVICRMTNGTQIEWKNLEKVWQLLRDKEAFLKYVQDEIRAYLKES